jgi:hypothetical protein
MNLSDFKYRKQIRDRFTQEIDKAKKQIVIDEHYLFSQSPKEEIKE